MRPHGVSRTGKGTKFPTGRTDVEQKTSVQVKQRKQIATERDLAEIEVVFHTPVDVTATEARPGRMRSLPIVHEAKEILIAAGYLSVRVSEPSMPVNLIGLGGRAGALLILALRSQVPVPSAAKLRELYTGRVDHLRVLAGKVKDTIMIWVHSPTCGWRYYLIYPGGLRYDHDFAASLN